MLDESTWTKTNKQSAKNSCALYRLVWKARLDSGGEQLRALETSCPLIADLVLRSLIFDQCRAVCNTIEYKSLRELPRKTQFFTQSTNS